MTPLLAQRIALLVVFISLLLLLLMGYLLWLQCRGVAESDRERAAQRQQRAARWPGRYPPSYRYPRRTRIIPSACGFPTGAGDSNEAKRR